MSRPAGRAAPGTDVGTTTLTPFEAAVAEVLSSLGAGEVVTYGEVALDAGYPGRARAVGRFLARHGADHPWWRVVTATGRLHPGRPAEHADLLRAEGVAVAGGHVVPHHLRA